MPLPRLRPGVTAAPHAGKLAVWDTNRLVPGVVFVAPDLAPAVARFDGAATPAAVARAAGLPADRVDGLVRSLDRALLLDGPAFRDYVLGPDRRPSCVGVYPENPAAVPAALDSLFTAPGGPGLPRAAPPPPPGRLRAVLAPHMDYARGGAAYGHAFRDLIEQSAARLFVVVATSHYSSARFSLTWKDYATPLGVVETDAGYVARIADHYGDEAFADVTAHLPEHSIELELPFLQHYVATPARPVRVVPLLVGSFRDAVAAGGDPAGDPDVARMVEALARAEAAAGEEVCYLISGDLAHIGRKFRDPDLLTDAALAVSAGRDAAVLAHLAAADGAGYFREVAAEGDRRRVCGLAPTWLALAAARPTAGVVRHYTQYVAPDRTESVSFAAASFYA